MGHTRLYRNGVLEAEGFPVADVSEHVRDPAAVVWFDMCDPTEEDLHAISEELGLHALAVEDALQRRQRPKLDVYDGHMFLSVYASAFDVGTGEVRVADAAAFITSNALVTVRQSDAFSVEEVMRRWDEGADLARHGVAFLLHGLLDYVVDSHFATVEAMDEQVEDLEDTVFGERPVSREEQRRTFELRKSLVTLRRVVMPMREAVNTLLRRNGMVGDGEMAPYFQDVYDQVLRATEWTESLRDLVGNIRETQLTMQGNRMNLIMKRVTSWAAIIAVPTLITGFYGQNIPFPGFGHHWGFWTSSVLIVVASATLYRVFRARDWL
ncbi:magnesium transporter [Microbispora triticiradicis]|uniref:Magnesium transporter CorA family protein n=3 Tax=Microbispora TaxID=2005 RepID=A0ABY3M0M5_9ACTN|nr:MULTISPECIES: magnesium transporter CorA family protein [Microbispora]RGA06509.1 magnesium transporter [Microbispora triticiradicis]TLP62441.1 magnesium transporter CorA family protein [Microbispora fusca]TYB62472.1 magnesium transporter CorA family protein [Microbispora tritici]